MCLSHFHLIKPSSLRSRYSVSLILRSSISSLDSFKSSVFEHASARPKPFIPASSSFERAGASPFPVQGQRFLARQSRQTMKLSIVFSLVLAATSVMAMPQQGNSFLLGCKRCWEICDHRKAGAVARGRVIGVCFFAPRHFLESTSPEVRRC